MKKTASILLVLIFLSCFAFPQSEFSLTTYYPAPFSVYQELSSKSIGVGDTNKDFVINEIKHIISEFEKLHSIQLSVEDSDIIIYDEYFGEGYGIPNQELIDTVKTVAKLEGIFLDPVYNGKAMIGLIDLISKDTFTKDSNILFLHSGGGPAIFSYKDVFKKQ